jgi:multisubunit Na+/H+ antiporter MnhE subunit
MQGVISHISSMALAIFWLVVVSFAIGGMILGFRVGLAALRDLVKKRNSE